MAHEQAARLDPAVRTSVHHAHLMRGDYERAIALDIEDLPHVTVLALDLLGRRDEAAARMREYERRPLPKMMRPFIESLRLIFEGRLDEARGLSQALCNQLPFRDPCALYYFGRQLAATGDEPGGLQLLGRSVDGGFSCFDFMMRDPWLERVRGHETFRALLRRSEARERGARAAFIEADGERVLGLSG
ncbi:MAG: hypothetical protein E6K80_05565 [Candidatus Eisenbacteria bacterium]|uniref:Tetratricopeptide repeat protein n=1 Tax=Eiseniibacteriota bacterium TaxID=2212470 RepID=A0A538U6A7_UNCEI|nr:MAG: hypothetical protein E6K80_05565 [Candidatus Eisenbacteria bacterium]